MTNTAILLVAGIGSRLRPLTDHCPKALVPILDESILALAIRRLLEAGVTRFVFATGYLEYVIKDAVSCLQLPSHVSVFYAHNPHYDSTQNSVSLLHCREYVAGENFFKLDGDVLFPKEVLTRLNQSAASLAVAVDGRKELGAEEMKVLVDQERIVRFGKDIEPTLAAGESIGIERIDQKLGPMLFQAIETAVKKGITDQYYEAFYNELIQQGAVASLVSVTDCPWTEIDTLDDLERARTILRSHRAYYP